MREPSRSPELLVLEPKINRHTLQLTQNSNCNSSSDWCFVRKGLESRAGSCVIRNKKWRKFFRNWQKIVKNQKKSPLEICLKFVLSNPLIDKVVVGVDSAKQFKQIISKTGSISLKTISLDASKEINLINPAKW